MTGGKYQCTIIDIRTKACCDGHFVFRGAYAKGNPLSVTKGPKRAFSFHSKSPKVNFMNFFLGLFVGATVFRILFPIELGNVLSNSLRQPRMKSFEIFMTKDTLGVAFYFLRWPFLWWRILHNTNQFRGIKPSFYIRHQREDCRLLCSSSNLALEIFISPGNLVDQRPALLQRATIALISFFCKLLFAYFLFQLRGAIWFSNFVSFSPAEQNSTPGRCPTRVGAIGF